VAVVVVGAARASPAAPLPLLSLPHLYHTHSRRRPLGDSAGGELTTEMVAPPWYPSRRRRAARAARGTVERHCGGTLLGRARAL
jgi:hypothetical protein